MKGLSCIFPVPNLKKTTEFYVLKLGFKAVYYLDCKEPHVCLYRDDIEFILLKSSSDVVIPNRILHGYGYDAYIYSEDQEKLEKEFIEKNVKFVRHLNITDYNNKEFVIEDIDGRWIAVGIKVK